MIKDICGPSVIQFFVISTLLAYTNAYVVRCRRTPRDDGRFGFCESEGKLNTNAPINSKLQHPPPGIPRAFDYFPCPGSRAFDAKGLPGGGEFDLCLGGVGNLNRKCQV